MREKKEEDEVEEEDDTQGPLSKVM